MAVNWGLAQQPNAFERAFPQGREAAMQQRAMQREEDSRNALASYAMKPNEASFNALAQHAPEYAMQVQGQRTEAAERARVADLRMQGAQGNQDAILQMWGVDPATAARFDTREREQAVEGVTYLSQAALAIDRLPEAERPAAWDAAIGQGVQMGFDDLSEFGQYSPQALQAVVARAGQMAPLLSGRQPDYMAIPEGGTLVDTRNPQAVQAFGGQPQGYGDGSGLTGTGMPSGSPLSQPAPQQAQPQQQSPIFPAGEWQTYSRAMGQALPAIVERDRPVILNSQGSQVQTDVINGQIAYRVNGVWYDNPEGQ